MTRVLHNKTLGIVGLGHVGRHVASLAAAFGMKVLSWSRGGAPRELDELLHASDVALVKALEERRIAGAGLDVFEQEPLPAGHPFTTLDNVVLTPHLGWPTDETYGQFAAAAADALLAYLDGKALPQFTAHG